MPVFISHTHCQAAKANAQTKTWQRVCLLPTENIELKKCPTLLKIKNTQTHNPTPQRH